MNFIRNGAVGGAVGGLHPPTKDENAPNGGGSGAISGAIDGAVGGAAFEAAGEALPALKNLLFPSEDIQSQVTKDLIKKSLGNKVDSDVAEELSARINKPRMFSSVENELKLVKPQLDADLTSANTQLDSVLQGSTAKVGSSARVVNKVFSDLIDQETAGVGTGKKEIASSINDVRDEVLSKLSNDPMSAKDLNNVKRLIGDQVKKFAPPDMLYSTQKAEQEAYRQAYFKLRDLVSDLVPESKDLNLKISRGLQVQDLLEKKFPNLDTAQAAKASYQGVRSEAARAAIKKTAGYGGIASGLGLFEEAARRGIKKLAGD